MQIRGTPISSLPPLSAIISSSPQFLCDSSCERYVLHFCGYLVILVIVVTHRYFIWADIFNCFPVIATCVVFYATMEARQQERGFQVRSSSSPLSPIM